MELKNNIIQFVLNLILYLFSLLSVFDIILHSSPIITNQTILFLQKCHHFRCASHAKIRSLINLRFPAHVMDPPSFVSKARTAFNSAAAKAERVFTDFKSDRGAPNFSSYLQFHPPLLNFLFSLVYIIAYLYH